MQFCTKTIRGKKARGAARPPANPQEEQPSQPTSGAPKPQQDSDALVGPPRLIKGPVGRHFRGGAARGGAGPRWWAWPAAVTAPPSSRLHVGMVGSPARPGGAGAQGRAREPASGLRFGARGDRRPVFGLQDRHTGEGGEGTLRRPFPGL